MERRTCKTCGQPIPKERLTALPDTLTCVKCSQVKAKTVNDIDIDTGDSDGILGSHQAPDRDRPSFRRA